MIIIHFSTNYILNASCYICFINKTINTIHSEKFWSILKQNKVKKSLPHLINESLILHQNVKFWGNDWKLESNFKVKFSKNILNSIVKNSNIWLATTWEKYNSQRNNRKIKHWFMLTSWKFNYSEVWINKISWVITTLYQ